MATKALNPTINDTFDTSHMKTGFPKGAAIVLSGEIDFEPMTVPPTVEMARHIFDSLRDRERTAGEDDAYKSSLSVIAMFFQVAPVLILRDERLCKQ